VVAQDLPMPTKPPVELVVLGGRYPRCARTDIAETQYPEAMYAVIGQGVEGFVFDWP
jgi:hypothetical protein